MIRPSPTSFHPLRLNGLSENGWAVVERPSGAIAVDERGRLIMRLTEADAKAIATARTDAVKARTRPQG